MFSVCFFFFFFIIHFYAGDNDRADALFCLIVSCVYVCDHITYCKLYVYHRIDSSIACTFLLLLLVSWISSLVNPFAKQDSRNLLRWTELNFHWARSDKSTFDFGQICLFVNRWKAIGLKLNARTNEILHPINIHLYTLTAVHFNSCKEFPWSCSHVLVWGLNIEHCCIELPAIECTDTRCMKL